MMLSFWLHLIAMMVFLGGLAGLWIILFPGLSAAKSDPDRVRLLAHSLKIYDPLQIGALGVLVLSGASRLTDLKSAYRELFIKEIGLTLELKLICSFILIILSTYQTMGLAHRFVRRWESGEVVSTQEFKSIVRRLKISAVPILVVALLTLWLGIKLRV